MEQARIEHAPSGSLLTYITSADQADALVNEITNMIINYLQAQVNMSRKKVMQNEGYGGGGGGGEKNQPLIMYV